jgi:hypothetical protein
VGVEQIAAHCFFFAFFPDFLGFSHAHSGSVHS